MSTLDPVKLASFMHANLLGCRAPTKLQPRCRESWHEPNAEGLIIEVLGLPGTLRGTHPVKVKPCENCHHAYADHNGRSLGWTDRFTGRPGHVPAVGPPDRFLWGKGCSFRIDWHHTCPCSEWMITYRGLRLTQRILEAAA